MSKTVDFIENNLIQLQMDLGVLQSDRGILVKKIAVCDENITTKQTQMDQFTKELTAVKEVGKKDKNEVADAIL